MHGRQKEVRPSLPEGRLTEQSQDVRIVGHAPADDVVGGGAVPRRPLGEVRNCSGSGRVDNG